jgi:outer membrane cobalamin receptor
LFLEPNAPRTIDERVTAAPRRLLAVASLFVAMFAATRLLCAQVPAELRGRLTDVTNGQPVAGGRIDVAGRTASTMSDLDGAFVVRGLDPGSHTVHVRALGYLPRDVDVELSNGRTTSLDLALDPAPATLARVRVVATRDSLPINATTFDRRAIEASGSRDLGELLRTTPGVVITRAGGAGAESHISIRGSGSNEVLVLVDGVPLNSPITGVADLSQLSLETVDRVTVRSGAQSARYGGRALAGVVEVQTRRPTAEQTLLLQAAAWGERDVSATLAAGRALGASRASASLSAGYRTIDGDFPYAVPAIRGGGTAHRINSGLVAPQIAGTVALDGDSSSTTLRGSWQSSRRGLAGSIVQPSATGRETESRQSAGVDQRWQHDRFTVTSAGDATHERASFTDPAPPFGTPYADTLGATSLTASSTSEYLRGPGAASIGAEARGLHVASTTLDSAAPRWQQLVGAWATGRVAHGVGHGAQGAVDAGVRVDHSSLISGSTWSPRIAATLSRGVVAASISLGSAYAPPSLADQFFHEGVLVRANPKLAPERTRRDLEARLTIREAGVGPLRVSGEGAAYRSDIDGMILWMPDFRFIWSPSNYAVHRAGWELGATASLPAAHVDLRGTLNHTDVDYAGSVLTGQVAYRPRTTGSVTAGADRGRWRLESTTSYVGSRRTVPGSALDALDPYWLTDAKLTASLARGALTYDLALGLDDVFDRRASMLVDYPFPGRTWTVSLRVRRAGLPGAH